jgi:hypothetical protein
MHYPLSRRLIGLGLDSLLVMTFGIVSVGMGHGIAPLGLFIISDHTNSGPFVVLFGRLGIVILAASVFLAIRTFHIVSTLMGMSFLLISWGLFLLHNGALESLWISLPFLGMLLVRAAYLFSVKVSV